MRLSKIFFLSVLALCFLPNLSVFAQTGPQTIVDYYLLLPNKYVYDIGPNRRKELLNPENGRVNAIDLQNGYLSISGDAGEAGIIVALFKKPNDSYLIGVTVFNESDENFYILSYTRGEWTNLTRAVIPKFNTEYFYELPRYGTTISVDNENGDRLYEIVWANGRFRIKQ